MRHTRTVALCESAILLALAVALSYLKPFGDMPWGGSITILSMLPLCLVAIKYGTLWGLGTAFCYSWFQILQGGVFAWGLTPGMLIASLLLDYILAFTVLGFAGIFRKKGYWGMLLGIALVITVRFLVHYVAGVVLWANLDEFVAFGETWINRPYLYSLVYNGAYMLPELLMTVTGAAVLLKIPQMNKLFAPRFLKKTAKEESIQ